MKTALYIFSMLLLTFVGGCDISNDDPNNGHNLAGQWHLTHVSGGIDGRNLTFGPGVIVWTFNASNGMVTVVNNSGNGLSVFQSGTYVYIIRGTPEDNTVTINGMHFENVIFSQNRITLEQRISDGITLQLSK